MTVTVWVTLDASVKWGKDVSRTSFVWWGSRMPLLSAVLKTLYATRVTSAIVSSCEIWSRMTSGYMLELSGDRLCDLCWSSQHNPWPSPRGKGGESQAASFGRTARASSFSPPRFDTAKMVDRFSLVLLVWYVVFQANWMPSKSCHCEHSHWVFWAYVPHNVALVFWSCVVDVLTKEYCKTGAAIC